MGSWWSALGWWDAADAGPSGAGAGSSDKGVQVGNGLLDRDNDVGQVGVALGEKGLQWGVRGSARWKKKGDVVIPVWCAQTAPLPSQLTFQPIVVTPSPNANTPTSDCSETEVSSPSGPFDPKIPTNIIERKNVPPLQRTDVLVVARGGFCLW